MRIGFVSTWFERGAAYVTKAYMDLLIQCGHNVFVYARGGEAYAKDNPEWDGDNITWGYRLLGTKICWKHFRKWVLRNKLDIIFFNEQQDWAIVAKVCLGLPNIKIGSYIDYYKLDTAEKFALYDFLICNTQRHYSVFEDHPQSYFIRWGTDTELFTPQLKEDGYDEKITFFHSVGMSGRKGTGYLVEVFIENRLHEKAELVLHTQIPIEHVVKRTAEELQEYGIRVINKTVPAPGLYGIGDVYVYPTTLEGVGLTIYEAMASGLPVITTDFPPMNEVVNEKVGRLVEVSKLVARPDGYYWPLAIIDKSSLLECMQYYIKNREKLDSFKRVVRECAVSNLTWQDRKDEVNAAFVNSGLRDRDKVLCRRILDEEKRNRAVNIYLYVRQILLPRIKASFRKKR